MAVKSYLPRPSCSIESDGGTRVRNDFKIKQYLNFLKKFYKLILSLKHREANLFELIKLDWNRRAEGIARINPSKFTNLASQYVVTLPPTEIYEEIPKNANYILGSCPD